MTKAFCPGHITCFFSPVITNDILTTGSVGAGIRLNKGAVVTVEERSGRRVRITMDGREHDAKISLSVITAMAPGRGFDVTVENELPVSQGMGMSAAGAVAAGLCISSLTGADEYDAYKAAHIAEAEHGGGLGDVAGIIGGAQPIRVKAGLPPFGRVIDSRIKMKMTVAVLGPKMETGSILSDEKKMAMISAAGTQCVNEFVNSQTEKMLYMLSSKFSESVLLGSNEIRAVLSLLRRDHRASMCMLGNSIFTDADEKHVREMLGNDVVTISCSTGNEGPRLIRKA
jgi:pantoate kinase